MRVTIDLDTKNPIILFLTLSKGLILIRKLPREIRKSPSKRGFHIIWDNTSLSPEQSLRYRYIIGDDRKRIMLDKKCKKRITQILFTNKKIFKIENGERYAIQNFSS